MVFREALHSFYSGANLSKFLIIKNVFYIFCKERYVRWYREKMRFKKLNIYRVLVALACTSLPNIDKVCGKYFSTFDILFNPLLRYKNSQSRRYHSLA